MTNTIAMFEIGTDKTRVALMVFSKQTVIQFHLNRYSALKDVEDAVFLTEFLGGRTNISGSLRILIDTMYLPRNGGRANAQRVSTQRMHKCDVPITVAPLQIS